MILLDTNVLLWLFAGDNRLLPRVRSDIERNPAGYYISTTSLWEIATKLTIGKLEIDIDIAEAVGKAGFSRLGIEDRHIKAYELLPLLHRDPFDRMLVAQAKAENIPLLTGDTFLDAYKIKIIRAKS